MRELPRYWFGALDALAALVVAVGGLSLPTHWWPVDLAIGVLVALLAASGGGLIAGKSWSFRVARVASYVVLAIGLTSIALLSTSVAYLSGVYGATGRGGLIVFTLVIALLLPYLVIFPIAQLVFLRRPAVEPAS